jgi:hypothetical protein
MGTLSGGGILSDTGVPMTLFESIPTGIDYRGMFVRRKNAQSLGLTYTPQFSADLINWQSSTATPTVLAEDAAAEIVSVPYPIFINGKKVRFFRVVINSAN